MNYFKYWINETHSVPLFQKNKSKGHIDIPVWRLGVKGLLKTLHRPFAYRNVNYFVQFLSFPRSGHSLIGSLLDAHRDAIISHELDAMGLIHKGLSERMICGLIELNSDDFTLNGRYWNGFSYKIENQPHGHAEKLRTIGDKKGDWTVRWYDRDPKLLSKMHKTFRKSPRWILVTRNPMDNIATLSLRKNRTYDKLRINVESGDSFSKELRRNQESGNVATAVQDDMILDYERLCVTISKMIEELSAEDVIHIVYEDFCDNPKTGLSRICDFLDLTPHQDYLENCSSIVRSSINKSRNRVDWSENQIKKVNDITQNFKFLHSYKNDIKLHG